MPPIACEVLVKAAVKAALTTRYQPDKETAEENLLSTIGS